jgi:AcrR family transcriptional regulator
MVQKSAMKRGRPRAYDPDTAIAAAMDAFWERGYAATSLDDLSAATGMNRPSLYAAFGDKRAIYRAVLERYWATARAAMQEALEGGPLRSVLGALYAKALSIYLANGARGCFMIGTAVTEAAADPAIRAALGDALREIEGAFAARIARARENGEVVRHADPAALAKVAAAILYSLAVQARAGASRQSLEATASAAVDLICAAPARS